MARNIITAIDAGSSTIRVVVAEKKADGQLPLILGVSQKSSSGIRRGYIVDAEATSQSIKNALIAAEKSSGVPIKRASLAVGGISLGSVKSKGNILVSRADNEISEHDIKRVMAQSELDLPNIANKKILHSLSTGFKIDGSFIFGRPIGMKGSKLEVETFFITSLSQHVFDMIKAVERCGVAVDDIVASPFACSYVALSKQQKEAGCILANIGSSTLSLMVFEEGQPVSLEVFPVGSTHITNDIALGLQIPLEDAERMKTEFGTDGSGNKKKLTDIIEARLDDIFELVQNHLKKVGKVGVLPAGIILAGGGSSLFSLEDIAKASLKLPSKVCTQNIEKNFSKTPGNYSKDFVLNDPAWATCLGLASKVFNEDAGNTFEINLGGKFKDIFSKFFRLFIP